MNREKLAEELIQDEGIRFRPYRCKSGKLTIGIGRNLEDKGISKEEALYLLDNDIEECLADCRKIFGEVWEIFDDERKRVFVNMRFNLGPKGLRSFQNMIRYAKAENWTMVVYSMRQSRWYDQVGNRAKRLIRKIRGNDG